MQENEHPLAAYHFRVKIAETLMGFSEVSGIVVEYEHIVYKHGFSFMEGEATKAASVKKASSTPIICRRGVMLGASPLYLFDWLKQQDSRGMEVSLCNARGAPVLAWKIRAALPTKLTAPTFHAASNDVCVDTLEIRGRGISFVAL